MANAVFKIGFARVDITPPLGVPMAGYTFLRRASAIRDPLELNALAVSDGERTAVLVAADLLDLQDNDLTLQLRRRITEAAGVPFEAVFFHCTHTHLSPAFGKSDPHCETSFDGDAAYAEDLIAKACDAAKAAVRDLAPATIAVGRAEAKRISFIRRFRMKDGSIHTNPGVANPAIVEPVGCVDESVQVVRFRREGRNEVVAVNFGTHPDTIGGDAISADWPGFARRFVEKALDGVRCIFFNGAMGDVNHVCVDPKPGEREGLVRDFDDVDRGYEHARHMGRAIAGAVMSVYGKCASVAAGSVSYAARSVAIPSNRPKPEELPRAHLYSELHRSGRDAEIPFKGMDLTTVVAEAGRMLRLENGPDAFTLPVSEVAVGDALRFVGIPGEPFTEIGRRIKQASPAAMTFVASITNGYYGYFPTANAYAEGGYEARSSIFGPTVADTIVSAAAVVKKLAWAFLACVTAGFAQAQTLDVGDGLQVMWEDRAVDAVKTTARRVMHRPVNRGPVLTWDRPWERSGSGSVTIVPDVGADGKPLYRMYYLGRDMYGEIFGRDGGGGQKKENFMGLILRSCYAESRDGVHWVRPELGLVEFDGSKRNNIIMDSRTVNWGSGIGFFKDTNPACPPAARYKALASAHATDWDIYLFTSSDGIRFTCAPHPIIRLSRNEGRAIMGDTHLTAFYHVPTGRYHVYLRGHRMLREEDRDKMFVDVKFREILHAEFKDFDGEQAPHLLDFAAADGGPVESVPLYTPAIFPYYRDSDILIGFPTRYNERGEWTGVYDALPDPELRKLRLEKSRRYGLAVTDALFMTSRDGQAFLRYDEAFLRPGPERHLSWIYGGCYPGYGIVETLAADGSGPEMSIYVPHGSWADEPTILERWSLRRDGFASYQAPYRGAKVVTKELSFRGDALTANYSTSGRGRFRVKIFERGRPEPSAVSIWTFGDCVDRRIVFEKGDVGSLAGHPVVLEFDMYDADLYSFRFTDTKRKATHP